ncbi:MAG: hypothetical protein ACK5KR_00420 [Breznakia sp.]
MKYKMISKLVVLVIGIFVGSVTIQANETAEHAIDNDIEEVSEKFIDYFGSVFLNFKNVTVLDLNGNDITNDFYNKNIVNYNNNDFSSIKTYVNREVSEVFIDESNVNLEKLKTERSPFVSCPISKRYYKVIRHEQANGEIEYYLSGSFVWDRATSIITSIGAASIRISHVSFGARWAHATTNMSTSSYLTASNTVANFKGSFNIVATYKIGFITIYNETIQFSKSFSSYPFG